MEGSGQPEKNLPKLVRDKVPQIIRKEGRTPVTRELSRDESYRWFRSKLHEEIEEIFSASTVEKRIEELADLDQVLLTFQEDFDISSERVKKARETRETLRYRKRRRGEVVPKPEEDIFHKLTNDVFSTQSVIDMVNKLADLHQVIMDYEIINQIEPAKVESIRKGKERKRGGFKGKILLEDIRE